MFRMGKQGGNLAQKKKGTDADNVKLILFEVFCFCFLLHLFCSQVQIILRPKFKVWPFSYQAKEVDGALGQLSQLSHQFLISAWVIISWFLRFMRLSPAWVSELSVLPFSLPPSLPHPLLSQKLINIKKKKSSRYVFQEIIKIHKLIE